MASEKDPLAELEKELNPRAPTPYLHEPDTKPLLDGALCWKDERRVCGPTCAAFNVEGDLGTPSACSLLLYKSQSALALLRIAQLLEKPPRNVPDPRQTPPPKIG